MTRLQHSLIAAVLLSAVHPSGSAAESLEGVRAAVNAAPSEAVEQPASARRFPVSDAAPAARGAQPRKRIEFGMGFSNESLVNDFTSWDSAYFRGPDRVARFNAVFELPRETSRPGLDESNAPFASCCRRSDTLAALGQHASPGTTVPASTTIYIFAIVRKKGWDIDFKDGWKLLAGSRSQEYSRTLTTKVGFLSAEHSWETFRASYSFQVERSPGVSLAPSQALQLDYLYSPGDSIGFSYTAGREVADFGTLGILNTEVRSVGVRGQHWFKKDWAFTYQAGHGDHGSMPAREAVQLGLRRSF